MTFRESSKQCLEAVVLRHGSAEVNWLQRHVLVVSVLISTHYLDINTFAGCLIGGGSSINGGLYWYPASEDFSTDRGWPSSWSNYNQYLQMMQERLPSSDNTSPDGIRYLEQTMGVMQQVLDPMGFSQITLNDNPSYKDHSYGYSAYNVSTLVSSGDD